MHFNGLRTMAVCAAFNAFLMKAFLNKGCVMKLTPPLTKLNIAMQDSGFYSGFDQAVVIRRAATC